MGLGRFVGPEDRARSAAAAVDAARPTQIIPLGLLGGRRALASLRMRGAGKANRTNKLLPAARAMKTLHRAWDLVFEGRPND